MYICLCESHTNTKKHTVSCVVLFCFPLFPSIDKYTQTRRLHSVLFLPSLFKVTQLQITLTFTQTQNGARFGNARRHSSRVHFFSCIRRLVVGLVVLPNVFYCLLVRIRCCWFPRLTHSPWELATLPPSG